MSSAPVPGNSDEPLLQVRDLHVRFQTDREIVQAVRGVDFDIMPGEVLAIVGESGSGKTVTALAVLGLLQGAKVSGNALYRGQDLLSLQENLLRSIRGSEIGLVLQDPMSSLTPVLPIGDQVIEALAVRGTSRRVARERAEDVLSRLGLRDPVGFMKFYPHQLSGGMRQRAIIASAVVAGPKLLIADEPATALDVQTQVRMLDLLTDLADQEGMALILITHDLATVAGYSDSVLVMYAGKVMESGATDDLFYNSTHPYTWALQGSTLSMEDPPRMQLAAIPGQPPSPINPPPGCPFHPRCPYGEDICSSREPRFIVSPGTSLRAACHFAGTLPRPVHLLSRSQDARTP